MQRGVEHEATTGDTCYCEPTLAERSCGSEGSRQRSIQSRCGFAFLARLMR